MCEREIVSSETEAIMSNDFTEEKIRKLEERALQSNYRRGR